MKHVLAGSTACLALTALLAGTAYAAPPAGRYEARLCVAAGNAVPDCGPARVELVGARRAFVRVNDLLYALTLHSSQVDVVLKHGAMQIDGFTAVYEWKGQVLHYVDAEKGMRYEVHVGKRRP